MQFKGLLQNLKDLPLRTALALMTPERSEDEPMFLPQARALARYEAEAMRRRTRAITAFDAYSGREGAPASDARTGARPDDLT